MITLRLHHLTTALLLLTAVAYTHAQDGDTALIEALKKPQPWTDKTGRVFMATPKSMDGGTVVFLRSGGQQVTVRLDQLSDVSLIALRHAFAGMTLPPALPASAVAAPTTPAAPVTTTAPPAPTTTTPAPTAPMTPTAPGGVPPTVAADNIPTIRAAVNTDLTIEGKVRSATVSGSGHARITFEGSNDFILFVPRRNVEASPDWNLDSLPGVMVRVTGTVVDYNGQLEFVLERPDQIIRLQ
jgi:hypothetical protein